MAVQGHYNHYDDPDEFWDEEPLEIRRPPAPATSVSALRAPVEYVTPSSVDRSYPEPIGTPRAADLPSRATSVERDRAGSVDDVDLQQAQFERLRAVAQARIDAAMAEVRSRTFTGISSDRSATVRVSSSGVVLDIQLSNGFGDLRQPAWVIADRVNSTARAIVEAVNAARDAAAGAVASQLSNSVHNR